ncbi:HAD family phosphatase [uncultured Paraglaciecola sp.]|uniref:HAD family hydrolase n=1 Tax=uncultured Paraglaciecola sp. TaxID=1765024 RepID=UPI0030DD6A3B|tara:strand:+ start:555080 stop:555760 length:681 start_codon:yes stop_codon:yes gene_type:complete
MPFTHFDAILFDKDGTIFDSEQVCCDAWLATAKTFDVHFTEEMFKKFIGIPTDECNRMAHRDFGLDFPMEAFILETRRFISTQKRQGLPVKQGFDNFFRYLLENQMPVGVVTSSGYDSAIESFQQTSYLQDLNVLVTIDDVTHPKPAPDCYLLACQKLSISPERVLVFEDSKAGIEASLAAGCHTVAIPDLLELEPALLARCLDTLTSFDQAYKILEQPALIQTNV